MAKKNGFGLGRGLEALMSETNEDNSSEVSLEKNIDSSSAKLPEGISADENGTLWVNPALLKPNPHQPRQEFSEDDLQELSDSIKENGVLQPILIENVGDGTFYIIAGERRTRASRLAGLTKVPVQIGKFNEVKKLEVALIENIQRADLNPVDEAKAYYKLMELGGLSQDDVAKRVGKKRSTVANSLRLLKLPEDMQSALVNGKITAGHARALLSVVSNSDQRILFGKIVGSGISVREAEQYANECNNGKPATKQTTKSVKNENRDPDLVAIEQELIEKLGTKVTIKGDLNHGSLQIDYFNSDDLDRLYQIITK